MECNSYNSKTCSPLLLILCGFLWPWKPHGISKIIGDVLLNPWDDFPSNKNQKMFLFFLIPPKKYLSAMQMMFQMILN
jgi:hypothetical protein